MTRYPQPDLSGSPPKGRFPKKNRYDTWDTVQYAGKFASVIAARRQPVSAVRQLPAAYVTSLDASGSSSSGRPITPPAWWTLVRRSAWFLHLSIISSAEIMPRL